MELEKALKLLKENKCQLLKETTAVSAPEYVLGQCIYDAIQAYKKEVELQRRQSAADEDDEDVAACDRWMDAIEKAENKIEDYDSLAKPILKLLGLADYNPYAG